MTKEELLEMLFPEGNKLNIPEEVIPKSLWTTTDLYDIFFDMWENEYDDWLSEELEEIFTEMWNENKEEFYEMSPPSEWGFPYQDFICKWIREYGEKQTT